MLLRTYIYILIAVIMAPFYILFGIIPARRMNFWGWIRVMAAHLLPYPAVVFIILLSRVMSDNFKHSPKALFIPPLLANPSGGGPTGADNPFGAVIAFGVILIAPEVLRLLRQVFGLQDLGIGTAAMQGFMAGPRFLTNASRSIGGAGMDYFTGRNPVVPKGMGAVMRGFFGR